MALNNNIFYATNPARMTDALMRVIDASGVDLADMLIFLPSRRAVRTVEQALVARSSGGALILPQMCALGEGSDEIDEDDDEINSSDIIDDTERVVVLSRLLAADANIGNMSTALPVARDLLRMTDYLENEGINAADIDWTGLVDEKYAAHFQRKARILEILSIALPHVYNGRITRTTARNRDIRGWINKLDNYKLVVVCGSTGSVPATADLMAEIATRKNGRIILPGKISGNADDFVLNTNPYNSEYKFLRRIGIAPNEIIPIDVGTSAIEFMNDAFGNEAARSKFPSEIKHCHLVECNRESEEAAAVAEIAARAINEKKSVLVITPDAAGNQRIAAAMRARNIVADFSGGVSGTMTNAGRAILNAMDDWIERGDDTFERLYNAAGQNLFQMFLNLAQTEYNFMPMFTAEDAATPLVFGAIENLATCLCKNDIVLGASDARAFVADAISGVTIRSQMPDDASVVVLGTIESRMQTADVVILTGLNDGMFPATGYENAWLPRDLAEQIGLPSPDRKVSLMSLDFMNLSCGGEVYWTRSRMSGGAQTTESRFLSRVRVRGGEFDLMVGTDILSSVRARDDVPARRLDYSAPMPPADWTDVYVTELELLIHNPYAFYVRHILRLRVLDDYWVGADARAFGNLVHGVLENANGASVEEIVSRMDAAARKILGRDNIIFYFWHERFMEIAPVALCELARSQNGFAEIGGAVKIAGRNIRARADRVWDGGVMDIKTGAVPNKKQLLEGNMPQLGLEAYMLQSGGFPIQTSAASRTPIMTFLQLKNGDVRSITYDTETTQQMINAAVAKTTELVNMYSAGDAPYEYRETSEPKYQIYDDLARCDD